jgi:hypothetical protein
MTYEAYQQYMARYGFTSSPLTEQQFQHCLDNKVEWYGASCDVNAGVDFAVACKVNPVVEEVYE